MSTSKAQQILLSIFGNPISGFTSVGYPTEGETVSFWMWLMSLEGETKRGANRSVGHGTAVEKIANSLEVQWRLHSPRVPRVTKKNIQTKVRDVIEKAKKLTNQTRKLGDEGWYSEQQSAFSATLDIAAKETARSKVSHEVTKHFFVT